MIVIVMSITVFLSIILSAFVSFSPNFKSMIEKDFIRTAYGNAMNYSLKKAQLSTRANTLPAADASGDRKFTLTIPLSDRAKLDQIGTPDWGVVPESQIICNITVRTVAPTGVSVDIDREFPSEPPSGS